MGQPVIWSFDLGKGSIGEAVRRGNEFLHKASLLIPADFAETKTAAGRRRMWRTRQAHKAREKWLNQVMCDAGIQPLIGRRTEKVNGKWQSVAEIPEQKLNRERLEREFPSPGDDTCYTSCLLRIKLLQGEKLESWQIYKALHSAIQRRGYEKVPWAAKEAKRSGKSEEQSEKELAQKDTEYRAALEAWPKFKQNIKSEFHFPCYYQAAKIGLWDSSNPSELKRTIDCQAGSAKKVRFDRADIEDEIRALIEAAAKFYPSLEEKADYLLYGPAGQAYASYNPQLRKKFKLREGGQNDWQGVLGQKIPRFDNRIVEKCILIPRLNVCKAEVREDKDGNPVPESLLASEAMFLMKLKNIGVLRGGKPDRLNPSEIQKIFEKCEGKFSFTKTQWQKQGEKLGLRPFSQYEIEAPKTSGRSRFCRPALDILKRLILSGQKPKDFYQAELTRLNGNMNPIKGLVKDDLKCLLQMGETWEGIYIPNQKLDALVRNADDKKEAIRALIGSQNDPIVRHRLFLFAERLSELEEKFGKPEQIVLEFVREDFMGEKAKRELMKFQRDRATDRAKARKEAEEAGATERAAGLKMELLKAQGGICLYGTAENSKNGVCLYTGDALVPTNLDEYVIDHIVPRAKGGPDSVFNYVLTTSKTNDDKGNRTPFEWFQQERPKEWDAYVNRVRSRIGMLRNKKVQLLISPNAQELVEKYTALAETAWISKLAQALISIHFGWNKGNDEGKRRVTIVSGGLTGRIRRKYRLNSILNPTAKDEEEAEKKNRDDDRHHALDAMVISFIPNWARDAKKENFFRFPEEIHKNAKAFFGNAIISVVPENIAFEKAQLEETSYGIRKIDGKMFAVGRENLADLAARVVTNKRLVKACKDIETHRIVDPRIRRDVEDFLEANPILTLEDWDKWCANYRRGAHGPSVRRVLMTKSKADAIEEYKDISKDGAGQLRRGAKHQGYFVYEHPVPSKKEPSKKQIEVRPVYVFESKTKVAEVIRNIKGAILFDYFESGCQVQTKREWNFQGKCFPAAQYICTSIWANRNAKLRHPQFGEIGPVGLRILLDAGFERVKEL
jgi:CRISPR-associated endonuclease Csn1